MSTSKPSLIDYKPPPLPKTRAQKTYDWLKNPKVNPPPSDRPNPPAKRSMPSIGLMEGANAIGAAGRLVDKMEKKPGPKPKKSVWKKVKDVAEVIGDIVSIGGIAYKVIKGIASVLDTKTGKVIKKNIHLYHNPGNVHHRRPVDASTNI